MAQENTSDKSVSEISNVIDFGKIFRNYLHHWWWFVISLILCCGLAFIYVKKKNPVYLVKGLMMVNQEEDGGVNKSGSITAMLGGIGFTVSLFIATLSFGSPGMTEILNHAKLGIVIGSLLSGIIGFILLHHTLPHYTPSQEE